MNDYYCERNADVVILLDTLVSIGTERVNTLDVAVRAAASLAAHYLYCKDRVGLINYGGVCTWCHRRWASCNYIASSMPCWRRVPTLVI